jgi:hypothetical protein
LWGNCAASDQVVGGLYDPGKKNSVAMVGNSPDELGHIPNACSMSRMPVILEFLIIYIF